MRNALIFIILIFIANALQAQIDSMKAFENCRGKLPLPVKHFSKVIDQNKSTSNSTHNVATTFMSDISDSIFSICDSKVESIMELDSAMYGMLINVGKYFVVYFSIQPANCKKGDFIKQNRFIGFIAKGESLNYNLDMHLYDDKAKEIPIYNWFKWE